MTSDALKPGSEEGEEIRERRERLRSTFDSAAESYENARPDYPEQMFDDLIGSTGIRPGDSLVEVGCASGKATLPLARRGFRVTCVELGERLAIQARHSLRTFPEARVENSSFEDWDPRGRRFDLLVAATSWHWLDPDVSYRKAWEVLRPSAHLAVWDATHLFPEDGDRFFGDLQEVYEEIGSGLPANASWPSPGELADFADDIERTGLFAMVLIRQYDWERVYDAEEYIALLNTFSNHIAMQPWQRDRLYGEIRRRLALRPDGRLRRHWGSVLQVARRLEQG